MDEQWSPSGPIPPELRKFGKYPNTQDWKPADLLLVSSVVPDAVTKQIISTQGRSGFSSDDARWQHAAVYLGDGYVMEATTHGVQYSPIYAYLGKHRLRLRRPVGLTNEEARWRIALQAAVRANEKYHFATILRIYYRSFRGRWGSPITSFRAQSRALICSQLYSDSYSAVTGLLLTQTVADVITPAALSASDKFEDVPLYWKTIRN